MEITGVFHVNGRGTVVSVKDLPRGVVTGCLLHQGDKAWKIAGVEMASRPLREIGLVVRPLGHKDDPQVGAFEL